MNDFYTKYSTYLTEMFFGEVKEVVDDVSDLPVNPASGDCVFTYNRSRIYKYNGNIWDIIAEDIDKNDYKFINLDNSSLYIYNNENWDIFSGGSGGSGLSNFVVNEYRKLIGEDEFLYIDTLNPIDDISTYTGLKVYDRDNNNVLSGIWSDGDVPNQYKFTPNYDLPENWEISLNIVSGGSSSDGPTNINSPLDSIDVGGSGYNRSVDVKLSSDSDNSLELKPDGLFTTGTSTNINSPLDSIDVGGSGYNRSVDVKLSADSDNSLEIKSDGLFTSGSSGLSNFVVNEYRKVIGEEEFLYIDTLNPIDDISTYTGLKVYDRDDNNIILGTWDDGDILNQYIFTPNFDLPENWEISLNIVSGGSSSDGPTNINSPLDSIDVGGSGYNRSVDVKLSADSGNTLEIKPDGLFTTGGDGDTSADFLTSVNNIFGGS